MKNKPARARLALWFVLACASLLSVSLFLHGCGNGTAPGQTIFFGAGS